MTETMKKLSKIAPEEKFKEVLQYFLKSPDANDHEKFMYQVLSMLMFPQNINTYRFLVNIDKH